MLQSAKGLDYLHGQKRPIVHKDLKPENILLSNGTKNVKLADFGLSKELKDGETSFTKTVSCTELWTSPEFLDPMLASKRHYTEVDIFSLGCVYFFVYTGIHPFGDMSSRRQNIVKNIHSDIAEYLHDKFFNVGILDYQENLYQYKELADLILKMIAAKDRLTTMTILDHPLFWTIDMRINFFKRTKDILCDVSNKALLEKLETEKSVLIGQSSWHELLEPHVKEWWTISTPKQKRGGKRRVYKDTLLDLIFCIRNTYEHIKEQPNAVREKIGKSIENNEYWIKKYPNLLIGIYNYLNEFLTGTQILPML